MLTHVVGERVYDFSHVVGERDLGLVVGVAIGSMDTVYVLGRPKEVIEGVPKVSRLTIGMTPGDEELVARFGQYGDGDGQYIWLVGIALGSEENVYVTDEWLHRVVVLDGTGEYPGFLGRRGRGRRRVQSACWHRCGRRRQLGCSGQPQPPRPKADQGRGGGSSPTGAATAMVTASSTHRGA